MGCAQPFLMANRVNLFYMRLCPGPADPRAEVPLPRAGQAAGNTGSSLVSHMDTELWLAAGWHQPAEGVRAAAPQPDLLQQPRRRPRRSRRRADRIQLLINENIFGNTEIFSMKSFAIAPPLVSRLMLMSNDEITLCFVWTQTHGFESRMCHIGEVN